MKKIRWGVLGAARIAREKVIPAMQRCVYGEVAAIASRDPAKASEVAERLGIQKAYGTYEDMLGDPEIDAIYNPLPNHLHVPWSVKAAEAGKHVLCEKPIALSAEETRQLIAVRDRTGVKIGEAFMARSHPQWLRAREIARSGAIGELRAFLAAFSYFNRDPNNVRNVEKWGGGGLMDIGCYPITLSRLVFGAEPKRVCALIERDPDTRVDRLTSGMMEFPAGQCVFTVSTQLVPYQRMHIMGTKGRIEVEVPVNAPPDVPMRLLIDDGSSVLGNGIRAEEIPACNQYTVQGDLFSQAILQEGEVPTPLEDALRNMAVIEALFRSAETGVWEVPAVGAASAGA